MINPNINGKLSLYFNLYNSGMCLEKQGKNVLPFQFHNVLQQHDDCGIHEVLGKAPRW